jgi:hypothetical protein
MKEGTSSTLVAVFKQLLFLLSSCRMAPLLPQEKPNLLTQTQMQCASFNHCYPNTHPVSAWPKLIRRTDGTIRF